MKVLWIIVVLAAAGWFLYGRLGHQAPAAPQPASNAVVRYGQNLANDVRRADEVRDKANAAAQRTEESSKALEESEPK